jgi:glycosyltransferase 2 family protein
LRLIRLFLSSRLIRVVIGIIVLIILVRSLNINLIIGIREIKRIYFLVIALIIPLVISPLISSTRWKILLRVQGIVESVYSLIQINFVSFFLGILLPSSTGFDAIRIFIIEKRNSHKTGKGGATVLVERFLGIYVLSVIGIIGSIYSVINRGSVNILYSIIVINLFISMIFWIFRSEYLFSKVNILFSRTNKLDRVKNYIILIYSYVKSFELKKILWSILPLILLFQISNIICGILIFKALDVNVPFYFHLAFFPLISIISIIPISISGLGLREGAFVYFYGILGIDGNICFLVSIIYYFLLMIIPAILGFLIFVFGPDQYKNIKNELDINDGRKF